MRRSRFENKNFVILPIPYDGESNEMKTRLSGMPISNIGAEKNLFETLNISLRQCFLTFFLPQHPFWSDLSSPALPIIG